MPRLSESQRRLDEQIQEVLRARGPLTGGQVADALGLQVFGVNLALDRLGRARRVRRLGRTGEQRGTWGGRSWATVWGLPEESEVPPATPPTT